MSGFTGKIQAIAVISIVVLVVFSGVTNAQFTTASLRGDVSDNSGALVPGATVTVRNTDMGFTKSTPTGSDGTYLFAALPVGHYTLTVEKSGFETYVQSGILLTVNQAATQPVALRVGTVNQEITVSGNASLVTTSDAAVGQLVTQKSIVDLPLN